MYWYIDIVKIKKVSIFEHTIIYVFKGPVNSLILDYEVPPEYDAQQVKPKREDTNEKYGYQNYEDDDEGTIYLNQCKTF